MDAKIRGNSQENSTTPCPQQHKDVSVSISTIMNEITPIMLKAAEEQQRHERHAAATAKEFFYKKKVIAIDRGIDEMKTSFRFVNLKQESLQNLNMMKNAIKADQIKLKLSTPETMEILAAEKRFDILLSHYIEEIEKEIDKK